MKDLYIINRYFLILLKTITIYVHAEYQKVKDLILILLDRKLSIIRLNNADYDSENS